MQWSHLSLEVRWAMGGIVGLLVVSTVFVRLLGMLRPQSDFSEPRQRIKTWWTMAIVFLLALLLSRTVSIVFLGFVSFLALKEYFSLIPARRADRRVMFWAYLAIVAQYVWVAQEWYGMFIVFIPVYMFLLLPLRMVLIGKTDGFLRSAGVMHWGLMATVYSVSHAAFLLVLRLKDQQDVAVGPGLMLTLVFLTQFNDVAQYLWGRTLGKRKIVPAVSPGKTWAGFLGGVATTVGLAVLIAPWLTPMSRVQALGAGLIIGFGGFIGDITISAIKRDLGVKDSSGLLPGHGGILDRIDSLTYTAPLYFHYVYWLFQWHTHGA